MCRVLPIDQSEITLFDPVAMKARRERLWRGVAVKQKNSQARNVCTNVDNKIAPPTSRENVYHAPMMIEVSEPSPKPHSHPVSLEELVAKYKLVFSTVAFDRTPVRQIVAEVAGMHGVTVDEIMGPRRTELVVIARHHAFYAVASERPDMSFPQIGRAMGGKDHTSVLNGIRVFEERHNLPKIQRVRGAHPTHTRYGKQS